MDNEKFYMEFGHEEGSVNISRDVLVEIAHNACMSVDGVSGFSSAEGGAEKGIKIEIDGVRCRVQLFVMLKMGTVVNKAAEQIQESVSTALESMAEAEVSSVDVFVAGVTLK